MIEVLVALPLVLAIGLICHEIGHAVLFALCGHAVTAFGSGLGRPFLVIPMGRSRFFLCLHHPLQGLTLTLSPPGLSRLRHALPMAGGILANLLLAVVGWYWLRYGSWASGAAWVMFSLNAFMAFSNAIPLRLVLGHSHHRVETDGMRLLRTLLGRNRTESLPESLQSLATLTPLLSAIRDDVLLSILKYRAALHWIALGNREQAAAEVADADALQPRHWPFTAQAARLLRGLALAQLAPVDQAQTHISDIEAVLAELGDAVVAERFQLQIIRAELLHRQEQWQAAAEAVEAVMADPQFAAIPHLPLLASANRAVVWADAGDFARAEAARAMLPAGVDPMLEFVTDRDMGKAYRRADRSEEARQAFARAVAAVRRLYEQFIDPEVRRLVREGWQTFFSEARQAGALPPGQEGNELPEPAANEAQVYETVSRRDRQLGRFALALQIVNAAVLITLVVVYFDRQRWMESWRERGDMIFASVHAFHGTLGPKTFFILMLVLALALGLVVTAGEWLWCVVKDWRGTHRHHHRPGRRLLVNALGPWLLFAVAALFFLWNKPLTPTPSPNALPPVMAPEPDDDDRP